MKLLAGFLFLLLMAALGGTAQAQAPTAPALPAATGSTVLVGQVNTTRGPLPGAVVRLLDAKESCITNADGSFQLRVPATSGPVRATVSYAGYADEQVVLDAANGIVVTMKDLRPVAVDQKQSLKAYQKTARKQALRNVKAVRRANR